MLMKEGIEEKEVQKMVAETIVDNLSEHKVCYNLKHDRQMLAPVEANMDMRMIFNGNEEHDYSYGRQ